MDTAQHVFYIIGSIALGLFAVFVLVAIGAIIAIQRRVSRLTRKMHFIADELQSLVRSGKSYTKYLGATFVGGLLRTILRVIRRRRSWREDY